MKNEELKIKNYARGPRPVAVDKKNSIAVRPMGYEQLEAAAMLERVCFSRPWSLGQLAGAMEDPLIVLLAAVGEDESLCGYVGMYRIDGEGFIANLGVDPGCRRQGVASALLQALEATALREKLFRLTLEVRRSNAAAITLYEKNGYVSDGVRPGFYEDPVEDAVIFSRYFEGSIDGQ
ncbi:MAG: ribosomal protein S18-alanine N-acetyltransferase [Oscillospiraceae bacterium]|nr:ribosomal protein S18-alanine N-acetyltransferase [Oscillospiraceae bacterium]